MCVKTFKRMLGSGSMAARGDTSSPCGGARKRRVARALGKHVEAARADREGVMPGPASTWRQRRAGRRCPKRGLRVEDALEAASWPAVAARARLARGLGPPRWAGGWW